MPGFEILLPRWIAKLGFLDLSQVFNDKLDGVPFGFVTKLACDLLATLENRIFQCCSLNPELFDISFRECSLVFRLPIRKSPFAETRFHDDQILACLSTGYCGVANRTSSRVTRRRYHEKAQPSGRRLKRDGGETEVCACLGPSFKILYTDPTSGDGWDPIQPSLYTRPHRKLVDFA